VLRLKLVIPSRNSQLDCPTRCDFGGDFNTGNDPDGPPTPIHNRRLLRPIGDSVKDHPAFERFIALAAKTWVKTTKPVRMVDDFNASSRP